MLGTKSFAKDARHMVQSIWCKGARHMVQRMPSKASGTSCGARFRILPSLARVPPACSKYSSSGVEMNTDVDVDMDMDMGMDMDMWTWTFGHGHVDMDMPLHMFIVRVHCAHTSTSQQHTRMMLAWDPPPAGASPVSCCCCGPSSCSALPAGEVLPEVAPRACQCCCHCKEDLRGSC